MWALIINGIVSDTTDIDPTGRFAAGLVWVTAPTGTQHGDLYDGTVFSRPSAFVPAVPQSVTNMQARLALHAQPGSTAGKTMLDDVQAAVTAASDPRISIAWEYAATLDRKGLFVVQMAPVLNLTDAALDVLFTAASVIVV